MKQRNLQSIAAALILMILPAGLLADDRPEIREAAIQCTEAAQSIQSVLDQNKGKASGELLAAASEVLKNALSFQKAAQETKHPKKDSRDEYWELVQHRRNLDAALSVSSLRKNSTLKTELSKLDQGLAALKPYF